MGFVYLFAHILHIYAIFLYIYSSILCIIIKAYFASKYTKRTEISAGETPEIRDACPIETGR